MTDTETETHYFSAAIHQLVAGMSDTVVVAVRAESKKSAIRKVAQSQPDCDDRINFSDEVWGVGGDDNPPRPATKPVQYLGTESDILDRGGPVAISELAGEKVTVDGT